MPGIMGGFIRNRPSALPAGPGLPSEQAKLSQLNYFYGEMPMPATQYATTVTALTSLETVPSVRTVASNASIVDRRSRRNGLQYTAGRMSRPNGLPETPKPVRSSKFQKWLIGPQVNYIQNLDWYIVYPAATVMFGGDRNLALSTRVDQLATRTTGGPGPASMRPAPRFSRVQQVPRYSTVPRMFPTQTTQG
jgi:hypothetical protein